MPDWITHIAIAYILCALLGINKHRGIVLIGAVLPDLSKLMLLFPDYKQLFLPMHTFLGVIFTCAIVSTLLKPEFSKAYPLMLFGAVSHLILDSFLNPYGSYYWMLYPFWSGYTNIGFIWADSFIPALVSVILLIIVVYFERGKVIEKI